MRCISLVLGAARLGRTRGRFGADDERAMRRITRAHFPEGFTILQAEGGWFDPARRRFVREASRQILVLCDDAQRVRRWARELAGALRQEELVIVELGRAHRLRVTRPRD